MTEAERRAIRRSVALHVGGAGGVLQVRGPSAFEALDRLLPCTLALREGQGRHTLLVGEDGATEADVVVVADQDFYWLVFDGLSTAEVARRVDGAEVVDPGLSRLELAGPFAWELAAKVVGASVVGLPYLELKPGAVPCLRAGRTGEYGYHLLVPTEDVSDVHERLRGLGAALDLGEVTQGAMHDAALENAFWVPGLPGLAGLDPLALQLQWRLAWDKEWPGSAVLRERRRQGVPRRLTGFRADAAAVGATIALAGEPIGEVRVVRPDPRGAGVIGYALVDVAWAHPGVPHLSADGVPVALVSPPFVVNASLSVKPQRHRYANRAELGL